MVSINNNDILQYISIPNINNIDFMLHLNKSIQLLLNIPLHYNSPLSSLFLNSSTNNSGTFLSRPRLRGRPRSFLVFLNTVGDNTLKIVISDSKINNARSMEKSRSYFSISTLALSRQA